MLKKKNIENNEIIEVQKMLLKQMKNLDTASARSEIELEVKRSGALSGNAQAYLKAVGTSLRVKEMSNKSAKEEAKILKDIGVVNG